MKKNILVFFAFSFFVLSFFVIGIVKVNASIPPVTLRMGIHLTCNPICINEQSTDANTTNADTNRAVSDLQAALKAIGAMDPNAVTSGRFGTLTEQSVIGIQTRENLDTSGETGSLTRAYINDSNDALSVFIGEETAKQVVRDQQGSDAVESKRLVPLEKTPVTGTNSGVNSVVVSPEVVTQPTGLFVNVADGVTSAVAGTAHFIVNVADGVTSAVAGTAGFVSCIFGGCAPRTDGIDPGKVPVVDIQNGGGVVSSPGVGGGNDGGGYDGGGGEYGGGGGGGGCFIAGTKILMADLSLKNIEDVVSGDYVMTQTGLSHVTSLKKIAYDGDIYAYNNSGEFFFTPNHPFMTTDGWKSFDPKTSMEETPDILVTLTGIGDTLVKVSSQEKILSVQKKHTKEFVYNFTVDKSHTYFANGYLVHNIKAEESGQDSSSGWFDWSWW